MSKIRPRILDLFSGAGGAAMGYHQAGFDVVGVDIKPQPRYPFEFHRADALDYLVKYGQGYDAIHASPPCQKYCRMYQGLLQSQGRAKNHPDLIGMVRSALKAISRPYVIENVEGSPLIHPVRLCGSMFGLDVQRHRLFECSWLALVPECQHSIFVANKPPLHRLQGKSRVVGCYGNGRGKGDNRALWAKALGIDWMTRKEMAQSIPPAYTEYLGKQLLRSFW